MSRPKGGITTTGFAVLGLLCIQPWSAYELTQQMARSMRYVWPRAVSGIYREPQKLVDAGYASVAETAAGPSRTKLVYAATPKGRRAFRRWLATPSAPPQFESESMLKFLFADQGSLDDAMRALAEIAEHADALLETFRENTSAFAAGEIAFPDRLHIIAVRGRFIHDYATALTQWARWAQSIVESWPDTGAAAAPLGQRIIEQNVRL
jgi:DNA-binding PadR family transcriptional regulator